MPATCVGTVADGALVEAVAGVVADDEEAEFTAWFGGTATTFEFAHAATIPPTTSARAIRRLSPVI
ncbi:MAG TPA: hypothetical protein VGF22_09030 [Acidimicrobiales bacterium]|jgi:hypothetical protein